MSATYPELRRVADAYVDRHGEPALRRVLLRVAGASGIRNVPNFMRADVIRALNGR